MLLRSRLGRCIIVGSSFLKLRILCLRSLHIFVCVDYAVFCRQLPPVVLWRVAVADDCRECVLHSREELPVRSALYALGLSVWLQRGLLTVDEVDFCLVLCVEARHAPTCVDVD